MRKDELLNILKELEIPTNEWTELYEIESILLSSGVGIYPNWKHLRFLFTDDGDMLVKHGYSKPYGARLTLNFTVSIDGVNIQLDPTDTIPGNEYYETFRRPKVGDSIRYSSGRKVLGEAAIIKTIYASNAISLTVFPALKPDPSGRLSFYDSSERKELSMHSAPIEGIYMNFFENPGKPHKKYGVFHEIIKAKEITEINLKLQSKHNQKIFRVKGGK